jgi:hypothetical protein
VARCVLVQFSIAELLKSSTGVRRSRNGRPSGEHATAVTNGVSPVAHRPRKPLHLVPDGLPAHKTKVVKTYVASTQGRLTLHFLPGIMSWCAT